LYPESGVQRTDSDEANFGMNYGKCAIYVGLISLIFAQAVPSHDAYAQQPRDSNFDGILAPQQNDQNTPTSPALLNQSPSSPDVMRRISGANLQNNLDKTETAADAKTAPAAETSTSRSSMGSGLLELPSDRGPNWRDLYSTGWSGASGGIAIFEASKLPHISDEQGVQKFRPEREYG
jgi:hypothetical protein